MSLKEVEADIKGDQLKSLYEAVAHLGEGKKQADKKQFELDGVLRNFGELRFEKEFQEQELQSTIQERDKLRQELKELSRLMKKQNEDKEKLVA